MGAWGYKVLENDIALDMMMDITEQKDIKEYIKSIFKNKEYIEELLLATEIVDISLNGLNLGILGELYDYYNWFKEVEKYPLNDFKADAIEAIIFIKNNEHKYFTWVDRSVEPRKEVLNKIYERLTS